MSQLSKPIDSSNPQETVAIIGGGISGLYLAYHLSKLSSNQINLFEASHRLGGKIQSNSYGTAEDRLNCEWGAIRFEWGFQPTFEKFVNSLQIGLQKFPPFCSDSGWELKLIQEICETLWQIYFTHCHDLQMDHYLRFLDDQHSRHYFKQLDRLPWLPTSNGHRYPHKLNIMEWLKSYNSSWYQALDRAKTTIRAFLVLEFNVMAWLLRWTKVLLSNHNIQTSISGNEQIIKEIKNQLPAEMIHTEHRLIDLKYRTARKPNQKNYHLSFSNGIEFETDKVILGIPSSEIKKLNFNFSPSTQAILNQMNTYQLARVFIEIKDPWWKAKDFFTTQHQQAEALHTREVYYYNLPQSTQTGIIMLYFERPYIPFWRKFVLKNGQMDLVKVKQFVARVFNIDQDRVLGVRHKFWDGQENVHAFNYLPYGTSPSQAMNHLTTLNHHTLAIVGDGYSYDPGFIQGALDSCDLCLRHLFQLSP